MFKKCEKGLCGAVVELKLVACLKFCLANIVSLTEFQLILSPSVVVWGGASGCRYIVHNRCCMHECFHLMSIVESQRATTPIKDTNLHVIDLNTLLTRRAYTYL